MFYRTYSKLNVDLKTGKRRGSFVPTNSNRGDITANGSILYIKHCSWPVWWGWFTVYCFLFRVTNCNRANFYSYNFKAFSLLNCHSKAAVLNSVYTTIKWFTLLHQEDASELSALTYFVWNLTLITGQCYVYTAVAWKIDLIRAHEQEQQIPK